MTVYKILKEAKLEETVWGKRIVQADARGDFTEDDVEDAGKWVDCACGNLDPRIPRAGAETIGRQEHAPLDPVLYKLGADFQDEVDANEPFSAARTLIAIERRAAEILAEMEAQK